MSKMQKLGGKTHTFSDNMDMIKSSAQSSMRGFHCVYVCCMCLYVCMEGETVGWSEGGEEGERERENEWNKPK